MKQFLLLIILCVTLVACKDKDEPFQELILDENIELQPNFDADGGASSLQFVANVDWQIVYRGQTRSTVPDWIDFSATSGGAGQFVIVVTVEENDTPYPRSAVFSLEAGVSVTFSVMQEGQQEVLVEIPDAEFKQCLVGAFDKNGDGEISTYEALFVSDISRLFENNDKIVTLEGLQHFPNIKKATRAFSGCVNITTVPDLIFYAEGGTANEPDVDVISMFEGCENMTDISKIEFRGEGFFNAREMFGEYLNELQSIERIVFEATPVLNGVYYMFGKSNTVVTIEEIALGETEKNIYCFFESFSCLEEITFTAPSNPSDESARLYNTSNLSKEALIGFFQSLISPGNDKIIVLGNDNYRKLSQQEIDIAAEKGWFVRITNEDDEIIEIPDAAFKKRLVELYDQNDDGEISKFEALSVVDISDAFKDNANIVSLEGLQHFSNIKKASYAFSGCVNIETIPDLIFHADGGTENEPDVDVSDMFEGCEKITAIGIIEFRGNGFFSAKSMFTRYLNELNSIERIAFEATPALNGVYYMLGISNTVTTIKEIVLGETEKHFYALFWGFSTVQNITFVDRSNPSDRSINFDNNPLLSKESLIGFFHSLIECFDNKIIFLGKENYVKLNDAERRIATDKGWILKMITEQDDLIGEIPDAAFKKRLVELYDQNGDGEISKFEAWSVTDISNAFIDNTNIVSLEGLQYFSNIKKASYAFSGCVNITTIPDLNFEAHEGDTNEPDVDVSYMFEGCENLTTINNIKFSGTRCFNAKSMFDAGVNEIETIGKVSFEAIPTLNGVYYMFGSSELVTALHLSLGETEKNFYALLWGFPNLQTITFEGVSNPSDESADFTHNTKLSKESLIDFFHSLVIIDNEKVIFLGVENDEKLTDEEKNIATAKGWVLKQYKE